ncbi:MAG: hypothetical protein B6U68_00525 [Candidatus Aenigmarchaeota archaeon ex4484_14]|nr:MAG: hypothetical protein B6U68_00525 [Candidatus Aenigmarchaeota archaeon ex4484_14]
MDSRIDWIIIFSITGIVLVGAYFLINDVLLFSESETGEQHYSENGYVVPKVKTEHDVEKVKENITDDISDIKELLDDINKDLS